MTKSEAESRIIELERMVRNLRTEMNLLKMTSQRPALLDSHRGRNERQVAHTRT